MNAVVTCIDPTDLPLSLEELGQRLFTGEILIFRQLPAMKVLRDEAWRRVCNAFDSDAPETCQSGHSTETLRATALALMQAFADDETVSAIVRRLMAEIGFAPEQLYWDMRRLRTSPSGDSHNSRRVSRLPPHRDNWGSNVAAQVNWWAPLHAIDKARGLALFPDYWTRPIANNSGDWNLDDLRAAKQAGQLQAYPLLPSATEDPDWRHALVLPLEPGDIAAFSGAHLHASMTNRTGLMRFSLEVRSVALSHLVTGAGAPDVDGQAPRQALDWFRHCQTGDRLSQNAVDTFNTAAD